MPSTSATASQPEANGVRDDDPIEIQQLKTVAPWWPYGTDGTYRLVRKGGLRAIAIGRRRYVTIALLREFIARHTQSVAVGA